MQIGEKLREAREEKEFSLDDIQEMTKIQKRYLVAIEEEDYHALPGRFYAKAFIREYAMAVDVDPQELLADFDDANLQMDEGESIQYTRLERSKRSGNRSGSSLLSFLPTLIVIILVIGIVFVAWTLYQKTLTNPNDQQDNQLEDDQIIRNVDENDEEPGEEATDEADDTDTATDDETDENDETEEQSDGEFSVVETGTGASPLSTIDFTTSAEEINVEFTVEERTYLSLQDENETSLYDGIIEAGEELDPIDVSDQKRIYFNIGNASGVKISINGVELDYPVDASEAVHQKMWVNFK